MTTPFWCRAIFASLRWTHCDVSSLVASEQDEVSGVWRGEIIFLLAAEWGRVRDNSCGSVKLFSDKDPESYRQHSLLTTLEAAKHLAEAAPSQIYSFEYFFFWALSNANFCSSVEGWIGAQRWRTHTNTRTRNLLWDHSVTNNLKQSTGAHKQSCTQACACARAHYTHTRTVSVWHQLILGYLASRVSWWQR